MCVMVDIGIVQNILVVMDTCVAEVNHGEFDRCIHNRTLTWWRAVLCSDEVRYY